MKSAYSVFSVLALSALAGCGSNDPTAAVPSAPAKTGMLRKSNGPTGTTTLVAFTATYKTGCTKDKIGSDVAYTESEIAFAPSKKFIHPMPAGPMNETRLGSYLTFKSNYFADALCTQPIFSIDADGTYAFNSDRTEIALKFENELFAINNEKMLETLNEQKMCGISDWKLNVAKAVENTTCATKTMTLSVNSLDADDNRLEIFEVSAPEITYLFTKTQ